MARGSAFIGRTVGWIFIGGISLLVGVVIYRPAPAQSFGGGDGRPRAVQQQAPVPSEAVTLIIERYAGVLGMVAVTPSKVVAPVSVDPIDQVRLAGVVGKNGETFAVFVMESGDIQKMLSAKVGDEVVAAWKVSRIDHTSAILVNGGKTRKFVLFE